MMSSESGACPAFEVSAGDGVGSDTTLVASARARMERHRLRARALREARLVARQHAETTRKVVDSGGGFLLEPDADEPAPRVSAPSGPIVDPTERPHCLECGQPFAQSHLFETFGYAVCDKCRDNEDAHALITRTEAKNEYLLKDCDLDLRPPPLRCVRRRNPHSARFGDMRLYLRVQVEARAHEIWGSAALLEEERMRREEARARSRHQQTQRRLRALRMDVRSSLFQRSRGEHVHEFGAETHDAATDVYSRVCVCGHVQTYEKM